MKTFIKPLNIYTYAKFSGRTTTEEGLILKDFSANTKGDLKSFYNESNDSLTRKNTITEVYNDVWELVFNSPIGTSQLRKVKS